MEAVTMYNVGKSVFTTQPFCIVRVTFAYFLVRRVTLQFTVSLNFSINLVKLKLSFLFRCGEVKYYYKMTANTLKNRYYYGFSLSR